MIEPNTRQEPVDLSISLFGVSVVQDAMIAKQVFPKAELGSVQ